MDYSGLKTKVQSYLSRTDLASVVDGAIELFEAEYNANNRLYRGLGTDTITTTAGTATASLPSDFEGVVMLEGDGISRTLENVTIKALQDYKTGTTGQPLAYAVYPDDKLAFAPTPDAEYSYTLIYNKRLTGLSADNTSNWLLAKYPHVYLYGVLFHMLEYIQDSERATEIATLHTVNMQKLESKNGTMIGSALGLVSMPETRMP